MYNDTLTPVDYILDFWVPIFGWSEIIVCEEVCHCC